jgi:hypothetical protein
MTALMKLFGGAGAFLKHKQGTSNIVLSGAIAVLVQYACGLFGYEIPIEVAVSAGVLLAALGKE